MRLKNVMRRALWTCLFIVPLAAQEQAGWRASVPKDAGPAQTADGGYVLPSGTRVPLVVLRTVSTRNAAAGDQIYLQTLVPIAANRRILIPAGSHVTGTITQVERPGKVKGKGQLFVRFDTILFPSGVQLDLTGKIGAVDGGNNATVDRSEGKVTGVGAEGRDAMIAAGSAVTGTAMGNWIGGQGSSAGIGAAAGGAAGLAAILLTRGPDAALPAGSSVEMVLQQDLKIAREDLPGGPGHAPAPPAPRPHQQFQPGMRWPWWGFFPIF